MSRASLLRFSLALALPFALVAHTFFAPDGWSRRTRARSDLAALEANIAEAEVKRDELRKKVEALRKSAKVQEHVVRDELGYVRPGDLVIDLGIAVAER